VLRGATLSAANRTLADEITQEKDFSSSMVFRETALVLRAQADERAREELINQQEKNILRVASRAKHRFVTMSDDEWAIALCAFSQAIDTYVPEKGAFFPYAEVLIRRSLIDAHRSNVRFSQEIMVSPDQFEGSAEEGEPNLVLDATMQASIRAADTTLRDEILAASEALKSYGFCFYDLTNCSPARASTRHECFRAAEAVVSSEESYLMLIRSRQLPIKYLVSEFEIPRKLIERYRKYIIAVAVIHAGDFPALQEYIHLGRRGRL